MGLVCVLETVNGVQGVGGGGGGGVRPAIISGTAWLPDALKQPYSLEVQGPQGPLVKDTAHLIVPVFDPHLCSNVFHGLHGLLTIA